MKDWKASIRTWERNDNGNGKTTTEKDYTIRPNEKGEIY